MQPFHTINISEICGEVALSQGDILLDQSSMTSAALTKSMTSNVVNVVNDISKISGTLLIRASPFAKKLPYDREGVLTRYLVRSEVMRILNVDCIFVVNKHRWCQLRRLQWRQMSDVASQVEVLGRVWFSGRKRERKRAKIRCAKGKESLMMLNREGIVDAQKGIEDNSLVEMGQNG